MASASSSASQGALLLQKQLRDLTKNPVDGFSAGLVNEENLFEWIVTIIGPPDTLYEGGFFNAVMSFPSNYPLSPPTVRFTSEMWHPNGDDPSGYELASERWSPVHTGEPKNNGKPGPGQGMYLPEFGCPFCKLSNCVESIVLSIISMLSSPNDESPANVEAAKEWREKRDEFRKKVGRCVRKSQEML